MVSNNPSPKALLAGSLTYSQQRWPTGWQSGSDGLQQAGFVESQDADGQVVNRQLTVTPSGGSVANVGQVNPTYDAAGNVQTTTMELAAIPSVAGSGGTETQATSSTTSYYGLPGGLSASRDGSGLVVQATDALGTPSRR